MKNRFLATLWGIRGNVRTASFARWKPVVDFLFVIIKLVFAISYGWDVTSGNVSKSVFFEGSRSLWA